MQVAGAYLLVVLIWSTTPLAIHWSNSSLSFVTAITLRMVIATLFVYGLLKITREPLIVQKRDWLIYVASALGLFPNMLLVYWAAQAIPSGLMSVIMGTYPFFVGIFSIVILRERPFSGGKVLALLLALFGLWVVHRAQLKAGLDGLLGIGAMVLACVIWGLSTVMVKKLGATVSPLRMGSGSLLVATPFFLMTWLWIDGEIPVFVDDRSLFGVGYLVLAGSVLGHTLWFFVLRECSAIKVSLITLITPVMAISWGVLAGEHFSADTLLGAALIVTALAFYQGLLDRLWQWLLRIRGRSGKGAVTSICASQAVCHRRGGE
jgi:drug/metabolite transporter (DMT)-like permease